MAEAECFRWGTQPTAVGEECECHLWTNVEVRYEQQDAIFTFDNCADVQKDEDGGDWNDGWCMDKVWIHCRHFCDDEIDDHY